MRSWLPPFRRHTEETIADMTPVTHQEPRLNDLDPDDEAVRMLTSPRDITPLPAAPKRGRGGLR